MRVAALLLALALAGSGPALAQEPNYGVISPDLGPDYPPKMGDVTGYLGDVPVAWETYDFSVGAFDASAWVEHFDGPYAFHISGHTPGDPDDEVDLLRVTGQFAGKPRKGTLRAVEVEILATTDRTGKRLSSAGQAAEIVIERIDAPEGSGYGSATGRITAMLCPAGGARPSPCRPFAARFVTQVQFNG